MREEVRGTRMRGDGSRTTQNKERRKKVPHGTPKDGKGGKKFHMEQTRGTKKPPSTGGFGVMNYNKNGRFRKIHMVEFTS